MHTFSLRWAQFVGTPLPVVALLIAHVASGLSAVGRKNATFDEGIHITGGLSYWTTADYRLHPENGNWSQRIVALPAWLGHFEPPRLEGPAWQKSDVRTIDDQFFYSLGNDPDTLLSCCRSIMIVPSLLLALVVYCWSRHLFGPVGGLISLALYCFSPTMLAHGFLTTSDMFAALFFTTAVGAQWMLLHRVTPLTLATACLSVAGLLLVKSSGVLIVPISLILIGIRSFHAQPVTISCGSRSAIAAGSRRMGLFLAIAVVEILIVGGIIWASYSGRYAAFSNSQDAAQFEIPWPDVMAGISPTAGAVVNFARDHTLLPEAYLYGFAQLLLTQERSGFFRGQFGWSGWTGFFPYCLAVKTPLEYFALMLVAAGGCYACRPRGSTPPSSKPTSGTSGDEPAPLSCAGCRLYDLAPLLVLLAIYWAFALRSSLNIGHRHILPTYPPLFIVMGAAGLWLGPLAAESSCRKITVLARVLIAALLAALFLQAILAWPHYLAYFNVIAGGPRHAYRQLVDSSLDWGQDLKELKRWLDEHPQDAADPRRVFLSYFGVARPEYYGIHAAYLPGKGLPRTPHAPQSLTGGLYCISATMLQSVYLRPRGRWNKDYEKLYQEGRRFVASLPAPSGPDVPPAVAREDADDTSVQLALQLFEELRFARLCSFLRQREPDDTVGYSILLYRLSDAEVATALDGPPAELLPRPEAE